MADFQLHKKFFIVEKMFFRLLKVLHTKTKMVLLRTERFFEEHKMVLHCCQNSLLEPLFLRLQARDSSEGSARPFFLGQLYSTSECLLFTRPGST